MSPTCRWENFQRCTNIAFQPKGVTITLRLQLLKTEESLNLRGGEKRYANPPIRYNLITKSVNPLKKSFNPNPFANCALRLNLSIIVGILILLNSLSVSFNIDGISSSNCLSVSVVYLSWRSDTREPLLSLMAIFSPKPSSFAVESNAANSLNKIRKRHFIRQFKYQ